MRKAIDETARRRELQLKFNQEHGIKPETIKKAIRSGIESEIKARRTVQEAIHANDESLDQTEIIKLLEEEMLEAAKNLEFERAAQLRDKINEKRVGARRGFGIPAEDLAAQDAASRRAAGGEVA
jgi:excinuclease ABC subunit B